MTYCYRCPECGRTEEEETLRQLSPLCLCGDQDGMIRDYKAEHTSFQRSSCRAVAK